MEFAVADDVRLPLEQPAGNQHRAHGKKWIAARQPVVGRRLAVGGRGDLDRLTRSLVRKILHHPSTRLRAGTGDRGLAHLELARDLFQLGEGEEE